LEQIPKGDIAGLWRKAERETETETERQRAVPLKCSHIKVEEMTIPKDVQIST
jgi:hypothetical protein